MLILQQLFNLSDEELEFQVNDRRSFEEFVGLGVMNQIPDATTIAFFRERLRKAEVVEELFELFETYLRSQGLQARGGQIIDATLVPVPKQRNTRDENKEIKVGRLPEGWDENPDRLRQKDLDARWVKKNGVNHYGYKNSICIDVDHGFIRRYAVTPVTWTPKTEPALMRASLTARIGQEKPHESQTPQPRADHSQVADR